MSKIRFFRTNDAGSGKKFFRTNDTGINSPVISSLSTLTPLQDSTVVITGTDFSSSGNTVLLGGISQVITAQSTTSISFTASGKYGIPLNVQVLNSSSVGSNVVSATLTVPSGRGYITIGTPNATAANRITSTADIVTGDQVEWRAITGTGVVGFNIDNTGVFHWTSGLLASFSIRVHDGTGWGTLAAQSVTDTTPDIFSFVDQTDVVRNTVIISNAITIAGITAATPINISGGEYSIDSGAYTNASGTINNNQVVRVRHTSSGVYGTSINTILTIGGVSDTFSSTTLNNLVPTQFNFIDQTGVARNATITSAPITIAGITAASPISIIGGQYSIDGGTFTSANGFINLGSSVVVRHTTPTGFNTQTNTTLVIGGVSDTFTTTTEISDPVPSPFAFTAQTNVALNAAITSNTVTPTGYNAPSPISVSGGQYSLDGGAFTSVAGTINPGQTVTLKHNASATYNGVTTTTVNIGGVTASLVSTTLQNSAPAAFTFVDQANVALGSPITSTPITITGITIPAAISIVNGEYSIDGGSFTAATGTISNNSSVVVRHTSSGSYNTAITTTLTVGGVSDDFTSTTFQLDSTPNPSAFDAQTNVSLNTQLISNSVVISGINVPASISVTNGEFSIDGGSWTANPSTINNNSSVRVRHNSSSSNLSQVTTTLTVGGTSAQFTSTTLAAVIDDIPDGFGFEAIYDVPLNTLIISDPEQITGINVAVAISIINGEYSIDGGSWLSSASNIHNLQTVRIRHNSSLNYSAETKTTLIVGGVTGTFSSVTKTNIVVAPPTSDTYSEAELVLFMLDNAANPPPAVYGLISNILDQGDLLINYSCNAPLVSTISDELQLNELHRKLLRHYISGNILREDNDLQSKTLGAEELTLYENEMQKLEDLAVTGYIREDNYETSYNGMG